MDKTKSFLKKLLISIVFIATFGFAVNVTLNLDMENVTVSDDGVHVAGSFQGWDPTVTELLDPDQDGVYSVDIEANYGDTIEFKYLNGNAWGSSEDVSDPVCGGAGGAGENRWLAVPSEDTALDTVCFASCYACNDQVWHVATTGSDDNDGSEENPFATIQAGIDARIDGDTVLVAAGTYVENINFNGKSIALIGDSRESTIIDGNQSGSVITIENFETPEIKGFTITNGLAYEGGGIYIPSASPILKDLFITNNQAQTNGGGLYHGWYGTDFSELIVKIILQVTMVVGFISQGQLTPVN